MTFARHAALPAFLALAIVAPGVASCAPKASASTASKIAALKELRDSGVITPEQYAQRVAQLQGGVGVAGAAPAAGEAAFGAGQRAHVIQDPQLGMAAYQVTTPADWRFQGEMTGAAGCVTPPGTAHWRADSPDGAYGIEFSAVSYGASSSQQEMAQARGQGCIADSTTQAQAFLRDYAAQRHPGARILSSEPTPDGDPTLQQQRAAIQSQMAQLPPELQGRTPPPTVTGGHVTLSYQAGGRTVEEGIAGFATCYPMSSMSYGGAPTQRLSCTVAPLMIADAPEGRLAGFEGRIQSLVRQAEEPAHAQAVAQRSGAERQQIIANGRGELAQTQAYSNQQINGIIANNNAAIDNIHRIGGASMAAAKRSSDALHDSSQAFARSMGDQAQFTTPQGQTFNASNQYGHTYTDGQGHVVQTNSAYPPGAGWTEMQGR